MDHVNVQNAGKFRLDKYTASPHSMKMNPGFFDTRAAANKRKRELKMCGYSVTIFRVTATGGLEIPGR